MNKIRPIFLSLPALLVILVLFNWIGIRGIEFGNHWDEWKLLAAVENSAKNETLLPGWYNYPSVSYWLSVAACSTLDIEPLRSDTAMEETLKQSYFHRARLFFLLFSSLSICVAFFFGRALFKSEIAAVFTAGLLAFSWEYAYHSRWMAPDVIMATFALAASFVLYLAFQKNRISLFYVAAFFGGLALGSKYPAGLILISILIVYLLANRKEENWKIYFKKNAKQIVLNLSLLTGIFFLAFMISTPGVLLEFTQFKSDLAFEMSHYKEGHRGHNVEGFYDHALKLGQYFSSYVFASWKFYSIAISILTLPGILYFKEKGIQIVVVVFLFPLIYLLFFLTQKVMIVRNYMVLIPFAIIWIVAGVEWLNSRVLRGKKSWINYLPLAFLMIAQISFGFNASKTIQKRSNIHYFAGKMQAFLEKESKQQFIFSPATLRFWEATTQKSIPSNVKPYSSGPIGNHQTLIFFTRESAQYPSHFEGNHSDYILQTFSPLDLNFNYYPDWTQTKIVVMKGNYAMKLQLIFIR